MIKIAFTNLCRITSAVLYCIFDMSSGLKRYELKTALLAACERNIKSNHQRWRASYLSAGILAPHISPVRYHVKPSSSYVLYPTDPRHEAL